MAATEEDRDTYKVFANNAADARCPLMMGSPLDREWCYKIHAVSMGNHNRRGFAVTFTVT